MNNLSRWVLLLLLGLSVYAQTFRFGFVFDDHLFIVNNALIKNFNDIHLIWRNFPMTRLVGMYSFAFNYYLGQLNPAGYHIFNFVIHLVCSVLVWRLSTLLFRIAKAPLAEDLGFLTALLFLVHPGQTQAVTYITQRFESMAAMFYLACVFCYIRARQSPRATEGILWFALAALAAGCGVFTKETIMTVPLMILAVEWIFFPQASNRKVYILCAMALVAMAAVFLKILRAHLAGFFSAAPSESHDGDVITPSGYLLTQARVFLTFLRLLVLPVGQNLDYDYPLSTGLLHPPLTLAGLVVGGLMVAAIVQFRRRSALVAFGVAWMLVTFSVNLAPRANVVFEHKLYLISFGFILALVAALARLLPRRPTLFKVLYCLVAVLAVLAFQRNKVWADELALWQDTFQKSPHKARVNANLGRIYGSLGRYDQAIDYLSRAIAIAPDNITYENRGIIYAKMGRIEEALKDLNTSIGMDPKYYPTYLKRSWIYQLQHNEQAALGDLDRAIALNLYFSDAYLERGMLWMRMRQWGKAVDDFSQVLRIDPFNSQAAQYKSSCLANMAR